MNSLLKDDNGIAYGIWVVAFFIVMAGAFYLFFSPIFNQIILVFNNLIGQNLVSQDTADVMTFHGYVIASLSIFMLIGVMGWGYVRALEKKREEGT